MYDKIDDSACASSGSLATTTKTSLYHTAQDCTQGDHSPDNVKFPDGSRHSCPS